MKKNLYYFLLVLSVFILIVSGCGLLVPVIREFNLTNGQYIDPRNDLELSWEGRKLSGGFRYEIFVNDVKVGETTDTSYIIPSSYFDWKEEYKIEVKSVGDSETVSTASATVYTYALLELYAVEYNSGPAVENAQVYQDDEFVTYTDEDGYAEVLVKWRDTNEILVKKDGYALSGLKFSEYDKTQRYKVILKKAQINPNPDEEEVPYATVTFYTDASKTSLADLNSLTSDPYIVIKANGKHLINIIYAAAGKIPGARFFGSRLYMPATNTAEGYIDISGLEGKTDIHIVIYDYNDNRVDIVYKANIIKDGTTSGEKYEVIKWSDFGGTNIDSYTRRGGIEFYGLPIDKLKGVKSKYEMLKEHGVEPMAAPKDTNLWNEVWFIDYDYAVTLGLVSSDVVEKPEAYIIYRSFDGVTWERAGVVEDTADYEIIFRDSDPRLSPGVKVYYKVSTYYPDGESTPTYLGYVIPLDTFNVLLIEPQDGATNVSRDPTFIWKPTNDAFGVIPDTESYDSEYVYTLWIYDLVQSENHLFPLDENYNQLMIESNDATEMSLKFSDYNWGVIALDYSISFVYPYSKLEPNKTYEWAVDLAYAYAEFTDDNGNINSAYSIAIDEGYGKDYFGVESEIFNTFTTGQE